MRSDLATATCTQTVAQATPKNTTLHRTQEIKEECSTLLTELGRDTRPTVPWSAIERLVETLTDSILSACSGFGSEQLCGGKKTQSVHIQLLHAVFIGSAAVSGVARAGVAGFEHVIVIYGSLN